MPLDMLKKVFHRRVFMYNMSYRGLLPVKTAQSIFFRYRGLKAVSFTEYGPRCFSDNFVGLLTNPLRQKHTTL